MVVVGATALTLALTSQTGAFAASPDKSVSFAATGAVQTWTVPAGVTKIYVDIAGAQGGASSGDGGLGAEYTGAISVSPGDTVHVIAGSRGQDATFNAGGGGGGGSFIYTTPDLSGILAAAGGGGGGGSAGSSSTARSASFSTSGTAGHLGAGGGSGGFGGGTASGGGGGGLLGDGDGNAGGDGGGGQSVGNGAAGGNGGGGFGGGGGALNHAGGGGGGFSGGGSGYYDGATAGGGGGGGSYFAGTVTGSALASGGGDGFVTIYYPSYLTSVTPATDIAGTSIAIAGKGLSGATVKIDGVTAVRISSKDTEIVATIPGRTPIPSGALRVTVKTKGGVTLPVISAFTYAPSPVPAVTAISPANGTSLGGTVVTITGSGFIGASAVNFGATTATFTITSDTSITAVSPATSAGTVDVSVTTPGGVSATSAADQFTIVTALAATGDELHLPLIVGSGLLVMGALLVIVSGRRRGARTL
jgi:hypothetical protein